MIRNLWSVKEGLPMMVLTITQAERLNTTLTAQLPAQTVVISLERTFLDKHVRAEFVFTSADDLLQFAKHLVSIAQAAVKDIGGRESD